MTSNIINGFPLPSEGSYKLCVNTITYNHSLYIEDCLTGVSIQETNFPFVHLVIDDNSLDGEQEIIKKWMSKNCNMKTAEFYDNDICSIIIAKYNESINSLAVYFLKRNMYRDPKKNELYKPWRDVCSYEAICEGDDYWTDANKLQKQVDFLDNHNDFTMCFHKVVTKAEEGRRSKDLFGFLTTREFFVEEILNRLTVPTGSIVMRSFINEFIPVNPNFTYGDNVKVLTCLTKGRIFCFGDIMGVYRLSLNGWTGQSIRQQSLLQARHHIGLVESFDFCRKPFFVNRIRKFWITAISDYLLSSDYIGYKNEIANYKTYFPNDNVFLFYVKISYMYTKLLIRNIVIKVFSIIS